ncbi:PE-PPE domain-containing protein [Nocardia wallacei]|uniref:PE-PPE domain-containing protein n=1 Tax=Nocardia wallacei TaxID=480035 RepID=UPI002457FF96|nr:PE-PPE domain-containing protein [Nocardia wallacei]
MTIDFYWLGGTGFGAGGDGISDTFRRHLDPELFAFRYIAYPGTFGNGPSYADSRAAGRQALIDAIRSTPNLVCLGGFSQGAGIAGDLAAEIGRGEHADLEVVGCALIADPYRPPGGGMPGWPTAPGYGIAGAREVWRIPTWWAAIDSDVITSARAGSPLRAVADITTWFSLNSPVAADKWARDLVDRARTGRWQRWWSVENWRTWGGAIRDAQGYLTGQHTVDYVVHGQCERLAQIVNQEVR